MQDKLEKLDILDRRPFVEQMVTVTQHIFESKKSSTFAIDGMWGAGKTFVLEKYYNEMSLFQDPNAAGDRYIVFRYNCWEYDYYEEPAHAIVACILDEIQRMEKLIPHMLSVKDTATGVLAGIGECLREASKELTKNKLGMEIDVVEVLQAIARGAIYNRNKRIIRENYDKNHSFYLAVEEMRKSLEKLSKHKPIIFIVDELDRCMPAYAIKVLERLHHVLSDIPNLLVIVAVDKSQLANSVRQIYGNNANVDKYLQKFIDFTINMNNGAIQKNILEKYGGFFSKFLYWDSEHFLPVLSVIELIFSGIDVRTQERIMSRVSLIHDLSFSQGNKEIVAVGLFEILFEVTVLGFPPKTGYKAILQFLATTYDALKSDEDKFKLKRKLNVFVEKGLTKSIGSIPRAFHDNMFASVLIIAQRVYIHVSGGVQNSLLGQSNNKKVLIDDKKNFELLLRFIELSEIIS